MAAVVMCAAALPLGARVVAGPRGAIVHIRWAASLNADARHQLERRFSLVDGEPANSVTWRYDLLDPSPHTIRLIVTDGAVEDTHGLDRSRLSLDPTATRTGRRLRFQDAETIVAIADSVAALLVSFAAAFVVLGSADRARARRKVGSALSVTARTVAAARARARPVSQPLRLDTDADPGARGVWTVMVLLAVAPFVTILCTTLWRTPAPINEVVGLFQDILELPLARFWSPDDTYYRPLFHTTIAAMLDLGNVDAMLARIKLLTIGPIALLVATFIWHLRPRTLLEAAACSVATAVLIGSPGFRDNLEIVLPYTIVGMCMAAVVWAILEREPRPWTVPVVVLCTLVGIGFKEQGLVILPVILVGWWTRAPAASRQLAATAAIIGVAYVAFRLSGSAAWSPFEQDVGFGFTNLNRTEAAARFGAFPYWIYAYNSASTISSVLFSEPYRGIFQAVRAFVERDLQPGLINDVSSSVALTILIAWWGVRSIKQSVHTGWSPESRLFLATIVALLASGALSFNYSRDRLGGMAVVFYAFASYHALKAAAAALLQVSRVRLIAAAVGLVLLSTAWSMRAVGTLESARGRSWANQRDWFVELPQRELTFGRRATYQRVLASMIDQGRDPSAPRPIRYPRWFARLIGQLR